MPKYVLVTEGIPVDTIEAQNCNSVLSVPCNVPLSETILCRNLNNSNASDMNFSRKSTFTAENYHSNRINHNADSSTPSVYEAEIDEPINKLRNDPYASELESNWIIAAAVAFQSQDLDRNATRSIEVTNETDNGHKDLSHCVFYKGSLFDGSLPRELYDGGRFMELVGCYCHPEPILSVTLSTNMNQLQLRVLCGFPEETNRILFMYSVSLQKLRGLLVRILFWIKKEKKGSLLGARFGSHVKKDSLLFAAKSRRKEEPLKGDSVACLVILFEEARSFSLSPDFSLVRSEEPPVSRLVAGLG
ncbi:hypothetical protein KSP39_PZI009204 [Platanthera zijinensis]|uniref:Uncharacterized protein n=1 Tax=Platanthera zijinensis TaxID=2320716 RepID=A0AAP0G7T3_9ASPA